MSLERQADTTSSAPQSPETAQSQSELQQLAASAEASRSESDLTALAREVSESQDKSWWQDFLDSITNTFPLLKPLFDFFSDDNESSPESNLVSRDLHIINTNPYILTAQDLEGYNESESTSLSIIAQAGIRPQNIEQLFREECSSGTSREKFFQYAAYTVEACSHFRVSPDKMFPLIMATLKMESNFNERSYNDSSGATGLAQHMPQYWNERSERLVDSGAYTEPPDIWDPRAQIFASVEYYLSHFRYITTEDPNNYPANRFARDIYLAYNCGGGHGWLVRCGAIDWTDEQITNLYQMPASERVARYGESAATFREYAYRRLTRPRGRRSFDKVQRNYNKYRQTLWGESLSVV